MKKQISTIALGVAIGSCAIAMDEQADISPIPEEEIDAFLLQHGVIVGSETSISGTYQCPKRGCKKKFTDKSVYEAHVLFHAKIKRYLCPYPGCDKSLSRGSLNRHRLIHTGEKPYTCPTCNRKFRDRSNFRSHQKTVHSQDRPFKCPIAGCSKAYSTRSYLTRHLKSTHKQITP